MSTNIPDGAIIPDFPIAPETQVQQTDEVLQKAADARGILVEELG